MDGWHQESATQVESENSGFDYITYDETAHRLFLGHRKEGLQVFDLASRKIVKVIDGTPAHSSNGALLMPEYDLGVSHNQDGTLTPFKMSTLEAKEAIKLAEGIDSTHYDPCSKRIVVNTVIGKGDTDMHLPVLEAPTLKVVGKVHVNTTKVEHAVADGKGNFYVASPSSAKVYRLDTKNLKVTAEWNTTGCERPFGLALDVANNRIFLGGRGSITDGAVKPSFAVMNAETGAIIYTSELGANNDGVIFDPQTKRIFAANGGSATLSVFEQINADTYKLLEVLNTRPTAKTLAYEHKNKKVYSMGAEASTDVEGKKIVIFPNSFTVYSYSR